MSYMPPVTAHAVLRYLTRFENIDLRPFVKKHGRDAGNWTLAIAACQALGVPVLEIQKRICPENLAGAVAGGVARIRRAGMVLYCDGGMVVTVVDDIRGRQAKILTKREFARRQQAMHRRRR